MTDVKEAAIREVLMDWNPLGADAENMRDFDDYETEAGDILVAMELYGISVKRAVASVLEQAFLIQLDNADLERYSRKIEAALNR